MNDKVTTILAAIDFSEPSFNALDTAVSIAEKCGASLYIIHAHDNILESIGSNALTANSVANNSSNILTAITNDINRKSRIRPFLIEEKGYATEAILKSAVKLKCDLIVTGTYGASGYRNGYIGTTAYSVIKYATCPVLLIPAGQKWAFFKKPLLPIRPVMTALRHYDIFRNFLEQHSTLEVLGLSPSGQDGNLNDLNDLVADIERKLKLDKITPKVLQCNAGTSITQNVLTQAGKNNSDLIIITPAIDVSNKQFYVGPNAHHIIHKAKIPLLIINRVNRLATAGSKVSL